MGGTNAFGQCSLFDNLLFSIWKCMPFPSDSPYDTHTRTYTCTCSFACVRALWYTNTHMACTLWRRVCYLLFLSRFTATIFDPAGNILMTGNTVRGRGLQCIWMFGGGGGGGPPRVCEGLVIYLNLMHTRTHMLTHTWVHKHSCRHYNLPHTHTVRTRTHTRVVRRPIYFVSTK